VVVVAFTLVFVLVLILVVMAVPVMTAVASGAVVAIVARTKDTIDCPGIAGDRGLLGHSAPEVVVPVPLPLVARGDRIRALPQQRRTNERTDDSAHGTATGSRGAEQPRHSVECLVIHVRSLPPSGAEAAPCQDAR
jgi:hypothetical protein